MAGVKAVIKIGGSLSDHHALRHLCDQLSELAGQHSLIVIPGGGPFADTVRRYYALRQLSELAAHKMAILAMDQYGYLLCDLLPSAVPVTSLIDVAPVCAKGQVPVIMPSQILFHLDPLPHSWAVTSDSIAAWFAVQVHASLLILLKAVDGLYQPDPESTALGELLANATLDQVEGCGGVDAYLPQILSQTRLETWVINGGHPERLRELIACKKTRGTHICCL